MDEHHHEHVFVPSTAPAAADLSLADPSDLCKWPTHRHGAAPINLRHWPHHL